MKKFPIEVSGEEMNLHMEEYDGLCHTCGEWKDGGAEPDAQNYYCPSCENKTVFGAEISFEMGKIEIC